MGLPLRPSPLQHQGDRARIHKGHIHHGTELTALYPARHRPGQELQESFIEGNSYIRGGGVDNSSSGDMCNSVLKKTRISEEIITVCNEVLC